MFSVWCRSTMCYYILSVVLCQNHQNVTHCNVLKMNPTSLAVWSSKNAISSHLKQFFSRTNLLTSKPVLVSSSLVSGADFGHSTNYGEYFFCLCFGLHSSSMFFLLSNQLKDPDPLCFGQPSVTHLPFLWLSAKSPLVAEKQVFRNS